MEVQETWPLTEAFSETFLFAREPRKLNNVLNSLATNEAIGAMGDAALDRVMLARVGFLEHHPDQFDSSVQSAIEELKREDRRADEAEARAMEALAFQAVGKIKEAQEDLKQADALGVTDWLVAFRLSLTAAHLEAGSGNASAAMLKLNTVMADAKRRGCVVCETEKRLELGDRRN